MKKAFLVLSILIKNLSTLAQKLSLGAELGAISSNENDAIRSSFQNWRTTYVVGGELNYGYNARLLLAPDCSI